MKTAKVEKPAFIRKLEEEGKKELATFLFRFYNILCRHEGNFPFLQDDKVKEGLTKLMLEAFEKSPDGELMFLPLTDLQEYVATTVKQALKAFEEKMERKLEKIEEKIERAKKEINENTDADAKAILKVTEQGAISTMRVVRSNREAIIEEIRKAKDEIKQDNAERSFLHGRAW